MNASVLEVTHLAAEHSKSGMVPIDPRVIRVLPCHIGSFRVQSAPPALRAYASISLRLFTGGKVLYGFINFNQIVHQIGGPCGKVVAFEPDTE